MLAVSQSIDFWLSQCISAIINSHRQQTNKKPQICSALRNAWHLFPGIPVVSDANATLRSWLCWGSRRRFVLFSGTIFSQLRSWLPTGFQKSCPSVLSQEKTWYRCFWACIEQSQEIYCCNGNIESMVPPKKGKSPYLSALNWEEENVVWERKVFDYRQSLLGKSCLDLFFSEGRLVLINYLWSNL